MIATSKEIGGGNSFYVANSDFAAKYPQALAAAIGAVTNVTEWAAQIRDKLAEAISADMDIEARGGADRHRPHQLERGSAYADDNCSAAGNRRRVSKPGPCSNAHLDL